MPLDERMPYSEPGSLTDELEKSYDAIVEDDHEAREAIALLSRAKRVLRNPDLMARVRDLIEADREAVSDLAQGETE